MNEAAPLVLRSREVARWILERCAATPKLAELRLDRPLGDEACRLAVALARAMPFPARRARYQREADEALVALRTYNQLAFDAGAWSARQRRFLDRELRELGRMLGGWMRAERRRRPPATRTGVEAPTAPGA